MKKFARYLVGQDPLLIEHHWNFMYRAAHFRGAVVMGALSALDIALWDIAGKAADMPVWALLGRVRDSLPAYLNIRGATIEEATDDARAAVERSAERYVRWSGGQRPR